MSNKVGFLKPVIAHNDDELHGEITTLNTYLSLRLVKQSHKPNAQSPDYKIFAVGKMGQESEVGAAWIKTKRKNGTEEFTFISISLDDFSFPEKLNVAAFKNSEGGWDITWRRRQAA